MKKLLKNVSILAITLLPNAALAAITVPAPSNLSTESISNTVGSIIGVAATILGVIALGIIVYGGFLWMTSGGNEESVANAKKIMVAGIIGIIIVVMAYAITTFIMSALAPGSTA